MKNGDIKKILMPPAIALGLAMAACTLPASAWAGGPQVTLRDQAPISLRTAAERDLRAMTLELSRGQAAGTRLPADAPIAAATYGELRQVSLGVGFEVNTIDPAALLYARPNADLGGMTRGTGIWKFVILSSGRPVGLLEMDRFQGRWQAVGAGSSRLAADILAAAPSTGDGSFRYVRVYQARTDLIQVRSKDSASRFVPLSSARRSLALADAAAGSATLTSQDLLPSLQSAVRAGLQNARH